MAEKLSWFVSWWKRHQRRINTAALVVGFSFDLYLAKRPDSIADNVLLLSYLLITAACIVLLNRVRRPSEELQSPTQSLTLLLILQFCYGGLANNLLILYGKSGTLGGSALFVALLLGLIVGNERLQNRYALLRFNVGVYYTLLLTYLVIAAPTFLFHSIGTKEFLLSGVMSLLFMGLFLSLFYATVLRGRGREKHLAESVGIVLGVFALFNALYFSNLMPPVPLSVKSIGIYHALSRDAAGNYTATYEPPAWFAFWRDTSTTYTYASGQTAYCFSAIFAPGGLQTPITHRWEFYNADTKVWETKVETSFSILGGRAGGYRGFSLDTNLAPGAWRCDVETSRGQLLSRLAFTVAESSTTPALSTATL